jgi:hypothetical protein
MYFTGELKENMNMRVVKKGTKYDELNIDIIFTSKDIIFIFGKFNIGRQIVAFPRNMAWLLRPARDSGGSL